MSAARTSMRPSSAGGSATIAVTPARSITVTSSTSAITAAQPLDQRGNLREAIDGLREVGRGEQCAAQRNGVYGDQHARDHAEVAEIRQRVRVGGLPYTDHSYEGVFNCILQAWRRSRNSGLAASRNLSTSR